LLQMCFTVLHRLVTALMLLHFDYCNAVLAGLPASTLGPLRRILYAAACNVLNLKPHDQLEAGITPAEHRLPVAECIKYKFCPLVHKTFIGHAPDYLTNLLIPASVVSLHSSLLSSSRGHLVIERIRWKISDRAFYGSLWQHPVHGIYCRLT